VWCGCAITTPLRASLPHRGTSARKCMSCTASRAPDRASRLCPLCSEGKLPLKRNEENQLQVREAVISMDSPRVSCGTMRA
jgi:hypothetical protein